uniref:Uncharacterized protein n=1 Tax=Leersia perrieri TaxID=77586 RepID=A0A0D9XE39_9ORYZ
MASRGHAALWVKLYELELQLRLMRAARGEDVLAMADYYGEGDDDAVSRVAGGGDVGTCRGRQYDAYMRRRDARRHTHTLGGVAASSPTERREEGQTPRPRGGGGEAKRSPAGTSVPATTPRKESGALLLPRARTVNAVAVSGGAARHHHHRRSSLDFGDSVTPRPFLKRGSGTGGAATTTPRLRTPTARAHEIPHSDTNAITMASPRQQPHLSPAPARRHHTRSMSELPLQLHTAAAAIEMPSPSPRARKQWGSPETTPRAMLYSSSSSGGGGESHKDFAKGLKKLLSFVRKSGSKSGGGEQQPHSPARRAAAGKPVMSRTGWHAAAAAAPPAVTA